AIKLPFADIRPIVSTSIPYMENILIDHFVRTIDREIRFLDWHLITTEVREQLLEKDLTHMAILPPTDHYLLGAGYGLLTDEMENQSWLELTTGVLTWEVELLIYRWGRPAR